MRLFAASSARCNEVTVGAEGSTGAVRYLSLNLFYDRAGPAARMTKQRNTDDIRCVWFSPLIAGSEGKPVGYLAYACCYYPVPLQQLAMRAKYSMP